MIDTDKYEGHTKGEWGWLYNDEVPVHLLVVPQDVIGIGVYPEDKVSEADMKLIADAPLLLAEVKRLKKELAYYTDNCTVVWMPDDVLSLDDTLTDEQVSWVLERMEHKHDACLGISWDTIEFWISEVKRNET